MGELGKIIWSMIIVAVVFASVAFGFFVEDQYAENQCRVSAERLNTEYAYYDGTCYIRGYNFSHAQHTP